MSARVDVEPSAVLYLLFSSNPRKQISFQLDFPLRPARATGTQILETLHALIANHHPDLLPWHHCHSHALRLLGSTIIRDTRGNHPPTISVPIEAGCDPRRCR